MNPALFVLVIFQVLLIVVLYYAFTPVLRPVSTQSVVYSCLILFFSLLLYLTVASSIEINLRGTKYSSLIYVFMVFGLFIMPIWSSVINPWLFRKFDAPGAELPALNVLLSQFGYNATVVEIDEKYTGIMSGISYNNPLIGIGKGLTDKVSQEDITAILLHEMGHARRRHVIIISVLFVILGLCLNNIMNSIHFDAPDVLWRPPIAGFLTSLNMLIVIKVMYYLEYDADCFAAKIVGKESYISTLKTLDRVTDGRVTRGNLLHPNLEKRIRNVEKHTP